MDPVVFFTFIEADYNVFADFFSSVSFNTDLIDQYNKANLRCCGNILKSILDAKN